MADTSTIDPSGVGVFASGQGATFQAPRSNNALALADSLRGVSQELDQFLPAYGARLREQSQANAYRDALSTSGQAFADAVRSGKIEPTQNPWYIKAYEENASQVRARGQVSDLLAQSQSWEERSNPRAYNERWNKEVGAIGAGYRGVDQLKGFQAAAAPLSAQALQANQAYNVQRIQAEQTQSITTLMTQSVIDTYRANPKASPADFYKGLDAAHEQFMSIGGTESQWNQMAVGAVIAAGTNLQDPSVLNILKDDRGGKGALANIVGASGNPVADDIQKAQYYIQQAADAASKEEMLRQQRAADQEGALAVQKLYDEYGYNIVSGTVTAQELTERLKSLGVSPRAAASALETISKDLNPVSSLQNAQFNLYGNTPEGAQQIISLANRARNGTSEEFLSDLASAYRKRLIEKSDYTRFLNEAEAEDRRRDSEARADARQNRSDARQARMFRLQEETDLRSHVDRRLGVVAGTLSSAGSTKLLKDAKERSFVERSMTSAADTWLITHPGDYTGARKAADDAANRYLAPKVSALAERKRLAEEAAKKAGGQQGSSGASSSRNQRR